MQRTDGNVHSCRKWHPVCKEILGGFFQSLPQSVETPPPPIYLGNAQARLPGEASAHSHLWEEQLQSGGAGDGKFGEVEIEFSVERELVCC